MTNTLNRYLAGALIAFGSSVIAAPTRYTLTDLGVLDGAGSGYGFAVNDFGQVAGTSVGAIRQATNFKGGVLSAIPTGGFSDAYGINNQGLIVGEMGHPAVSSRPFSWDGTYLVELATPLGTAVGGAWAVNGSGVAVGYTGPAVSTSRVATVFNAGGYSILPRLAGEQLGSESFAYGINNAGDIVGYDSGRAFMFSAGTMTELMVQGASSTIAIDIAGDGTVVGAATGVPGVFTPENDHAVVWRGGLATVLDIGRWSELLSVNSQDYAVGQFYTERTVSNAWNGSLYHALAWTPDDGALDLNDLTDNLGAWTLHGAHGISETGLIAGDMFAADGRSHAFLLTPINTQLVPEPEALSIAFVGLGAAYCSRKRRGRTGRTLVTPP